MGACNSVVGKPCNHSPQIGVLVKKRHFRPFLPFPNMDIVSFFMKNWASTLAPQRFSVSTTVLVRFLRADGIFAFLDTPDPWPHYTRAKKFLQPNFSSTRYGRTAALGRSTDGKNKGAGKSRRPLRDVSGNREEDGRYAKIRSGLDCRSGFLLQYRKRS